MKLVYQHTQLSRTTKLETAAGNKLQKHERGDSVSVLTSSEQSHL